MSYNGLQQYCYQTGFDHSQLQLPDPVGEAVAAAPCTLVQSANEAYAKGMVDGLVSQGVIKPDEVKKYP